ncbi:hypothetical protein [Desulfoplanes formicivorans]|uniref:Uncharacterized protein n=1 Tax=Desulfoplanes formicivorans TaxID=1592317 RepID=A0A194AIY3_9BACT|nr:hypothetical protein [Desulfoplanes formicivorans]GAU09288.1 hypothetical protein DPF_2011 [Desulfoplanes formicivorans]
MKTVFRIYENKNAKFESSIFDMINGNKETKQTKGLAYILKEYPDIIKDILSIETVKDYTKNKKIQPNWNNTNKIEVIAEKITTSRKRLDILIKIDKDKKPFLAIIIEAKSIKSNIKPIDASIQLQKYLHADELPELEKYKKIPIVLTNYKTILTNEIITIRWAEIINIISKRNKDNNDLLWQYYNFITGVNKDMNFYEKEVLSIPAGKTIDLVQKYLIYECPDRKEYRYKKTIFVTFRANGGGTMEKLYKIKDVIVFNPTLKSDIDRANEYINDKKINERLNKFISESNYKDSEEKKFYILADDEVIELKNKPRPARNNVKFTYYRLADILTQKIVKPASMFN